MLTINQRNLQGIFASLCLSFLIPASAFAMTPMWQSPYVGAYLGGGFGNHHLFTNVGNVSDTSYFVTSADINSVNHRDRWKKDSSKVIAGINAGHDWTWKQLAYGVLFDYSTVPLNASSMINSNYPDNTDQYSLYTFMRTNWLFTLRGRLGYQPMWSLPSFLYLTGGMALTELKVGNYFSDNSALSGAGVMNASEKKIGGTGGVGIEVLAHHHWLVNFEYLYVEVPSVKQSYAIFNTANGFGIPAHSLLSPFSTTADFHANLVKIGVNYRFDE